MEFKKINQLRIGIRDFDVIWDDDTRGGSFLYPKEDSHGEIIIGMKDRKGCPDSVLLIIIHELLEISLIEQNCRYNSPDALKTFEFHFDHKSFDCVCGLFTSLLSQFIK